MNVVGFEDVKAYEAAVKLVIGGARCTDPIPVTVRIPARGDTPTLIGRDPIFMLYEITFIEAERKINMIPYQQK